MRMCFEHKKRAGITTDPFRKLIALQKELLLFLFSSFLCSFFNSFLSYFFCFFLSHGCSSRVILFLKSRCCCCDFSVSLNKMLTKWFDPSTLFFLARKLRWALSEMVVFNGALSNFDFRFCYDRSFFAENSKINKMVIWSIKTLN